MVAIISLQLLQTPIHLASSMLAAVRIFIRDFDRGDSWRALALVTSSCDDIDVANGNGNHVVISIDDKVFISTNTLADTVGPPSGVTFTDITRNLPGRFVTRVRFDPNDPNTIYAVLAGFNLPSNDPSKSGHVFRPQFGASRLDRYLSKHQCPMPVYLHSMAILFLVHYFMWGLNLRCSDLYQRRIFLVCL